MRVKTEEKRLEILAAAAVEFRQRGYHDTTLSHVADRMSSSKATIYNYYRSKSELFGAMLTAAAVPVTAALLKHFERPAPFSENLAAFARAYVRMNAETDAIALQRLVIAEQTIARAVALPFRSHPELDLGSHLAAIVLEQQARNVLRAGDPPEMAHQLLALLHGDLPMRLLFGELEAASEAEMNVSADSAVRIFLAAYATR